MAFLDALWSVVPLHCRICRIWFQGRNQWQWHVKHGPQHRIEMERLASLSLAGLIPLDAQLTQYLDEYQRLRHEAIESGLKRRRLQDA